MSQAARPGPEDPGPADLELELEIAEAYREHAPAVRRSALRAAQGDSCAADDATQEAFLQAVVIWPKFRRWPPEKQRAWLCIAARHRVIDSWRASRGQVAVGTLSHDEQTGWSTEDIILSDVAVDGFWKLVTDMPQRARQAAYLRWHEEWTMTKIAEYLGIDRATVLRDLRAVIDTARKQLGDEIGFPGANDGKEA